MTRTYIRPEPPSRAPAIKHNGGKIHENNHGWGSHVIEFFALITPVLDIND